MDYLRIHDLIILKAIEIHGQNNTFHAKMIGHHMHHIKPKCFGGSNKKNNIVALTPRQHFVVHWLLWKIYGGKMAIAFKMMSHGKHTSAGRITSKVYEKLCLDSRKAAFSDIKWRDNHFRAINRMDTHPEWYKNTCSAAKERSIDPDWIRKNKEANIKTTTSQEWRDKQKAGAIKMAKPTVCIDIGGCIVDCIIGAAEAKEKGYSNKGISGAITGKTKTHCGYKWRLATREEVELLRPNHEWLKYN